MRKAAQEGEEVVALVEEVQGVAARVELTLAEETHTFDGMAGDGCHISSRNQEKPPGLEERHST